MHRQRDGMPTSHFSLVSLEKSSRLLNHGPTVLVSAQRAGVQNVMAAAWAYDFDDGPDDLRTIHHVAGGHFFVTGEVVSGQALAQIMTNATSILNFWLEVLTPKQHFVKDAALRNDSRGVTEMS